MIVIFSINNFNDQLIAWNRAVLLALRSNKTEHGCMPSFCSEKYIPNCDHEGFYHKEQCMGGVGSSQTCWCVTPNGSEIPGSRITGRAHCGMPLFQQFFFFFNLGLHC